MNTPRPTCWDCLRPRSHCHCNLIEPFTAVCNVIVLQHPRERKRYHSTVRLFSKWIINCHVLQDEVFSEEQVRQVFSNNQLVVLFPKKTLHPTNSFTFDRDLSVIVIDGTWREANKLYRMNPWLESLPHIGLRHQHESRFRIRKQPREGCLSSIEALAHLFMEVTPRESNEHCLSLIKGFRKMVDTQIGSVPEAAAPLFKDR